MAVHANVSSPCLDHHFEARSVIIELPGVASLDGVELDISRTQIQLILLDPDGLPCPPSVIALPLELLDAGPAVAKFSRKRSQLTVTWAAQGSEIQTSTSEASESVPPPPPASTEPALTKPEAKFAEPIPEVAADNKATQQPSSEPALTKPVTKAATPIPAPDNAAAQLKSSEPEPAKPVASDNGAYGSIWNANSWHWEERNCLEMVSAEIRRALENCGKTHFQHVRELDGSGAVLKDVEVKGEANILLRRGKRFVNYEVDVSFKWEARDEFGHTLGVKGTGEVSSLTHEEDETPEVVIKLSAGACGSNVNAGKAVGGWLKQKGARHIGESIAGEKITPVVLAAVAAQADSKSDAARRAEELAKTALAKQESGMKQARIYTEQKQIEAASRVAAQSEKTTVDGSVWNPNAWHWEERSMTSWSQTWLTRELVALSVPLCGGTASAVLSGVDVSGDASVSIRKGRPIVLFQLSITARWKAAPGNEGLLMGEAQGTVSILDFTSEDGAKNAAVEVQVSSDNSTRILPQEFRRDGVRAVRALLGRYVEALKGQLPPSARTTAQPETA